MAALFAVLLLCSLSTAAGIAELGLNDSRIDTPAGRADVAMRDARELSEAALGRLDTLLAVAVEPAERRMLQRLGLQVRAVAKRTEGLQDDIEAWAREVEPGDELGLAHARLLRALLAEQKAQAALALSELRSALDALLAQCPAASSLRMATLEASMPAMSTQAATAVPLLRSFPRCDYRAISFGLRIRERLLLAGGTLAEVRADAQTRLDLARAAGDASRAAEAWMMLAHLAAREGEALAEVERYEARARELMSSLDDPGLDARRLLTESATAAFLGQPERVLQRSSAALARARSAGLVGLEVRAMNNRADAFLRLGRHAEALQESERALVLARAVGDLPVQRTLLTNAGVARIALGQSELAQADFDAAEALLDRLGGDGDRVLLLREFGEAFAKAGDAPSALTLFHRERELSDRLRQQNMVAALREVEAGLNAELRQRELELLQSQLELRSSELEARDLQLRLGFLASAVVVLLLVASVMLQRRLRRTRRHLIQSREQLRAQSELDPLTGLANRRGLERWLGEAGTSLQGCLLLMDIDHFKQVNDRHGHSAGDTVLREFAARLSSCVRQGDLLVRWGGEEFLLLARDLPMARLLPLAQRLMAGTSGSPVETESGAITVHLSIGACGFGGEGRASIGSYAEALEIADLALYAAKSRGRRRTVAVVGRAEGVEAEAVAADFERAEREGWITVRTGVLHS